MLLLRAATNTIPRRLCENLTLFRFSSAALAKALCRYSLRLSKNVELQLRIGFFRIWGIFGFFGFLLEFGLFRYGGAFLEAGVRKLHFGGFFFRMVNYVVLLEIWSLT
jgi:hypothetical protein